MIIIVIVPHLGENSKHLGKSYKKEEES